MKDDLVSVIVPTFNRAYCLLRTIDSVRSQSNQNWELILVDDGSTDNTADLIQSRYAHDPRIRYIFQENAGVSAARNTGIRASSGQYIALLDSDDVWKPWKLEMQLACFRAFPEIGMVWTDFEAMDPDGNVVDQRYLRTMYHAYRFFPTPADLFSKARELSSIWQADPALHGGSSAYVGNIYAAMLRGNLVHTSTVLLSRERMSKVKEFDESLILSGEDYDFHFRTCKWGSVCFIDIPSACYQLDFDDRLSRHKLHIALNFAKTVQAAVSREMHTDQFALGTIHEVLAEAHGWIAEELFKSRERAGVRRHAFLSLRHRIWQPRQVFLLVLATVPRRFAEFLLRTRQRFKRTGQPQERSLAERRTL